jgi:hypothetical protein
VPVTPTEMRSLCRVHTDSAIRSLAKIMSEVDAPHAARVAAALGLLDRGWGRPTAVIATEDGQPLTVVIRQIIEKIDEPALKVVEPVVRTIDHEPDDVSRETTVDETGTNGAAPKDVP